MPSYLRPARHKYVTSYRQHPVLTVGLTVSVLFCLLGFVSPLGSAGVAIASLLSLVATCRAAKASRGRLRGAWTAISTATSALLVLGITWALATRDATGTPVNILPWTLGATVAFSCLTLGFTSLVSASRVEMARRLLDVVTVGCGIGSVAWTLSMISNTPTKLELWTAHKSWGLVDELIVSIAICCLLLVSGAIAGTARHRQTLGFWPAMGWLIATLTLGASIITMSQQFIEHVDKLSIGIVAGHIGTIWAVISNTKKVPRPRAKRYGLHPYLPHVSLMITTLLASFQRLLYNEFDVTLGIIVGLVTALVIIRSHLIIRDNDQLLQELDQHEQDLRKHAYQDDLTELDNRHKFVEVLEKTLQTPITDSVTIAYLDLDGFKNINDTHGHACGDVVLKEVGRRLALCVPGAPSVARIAGDEYAAILPAEHSAEHYATHIVDHISAPIDIGHCQESVTCSVGLTHYRAGSVATNAERLLHEADIALYQVKSTSKNAFASYCPATMPTAQVPAPRSPKTTAPEIASGNVTAEPWSE